MEESSLTERSMQVYDRQGNSRIFASLAYVQFFSIKDVCQRKPDEQMIGLY
jgi:hypothetical protein